MRRLLILVFVLLLPLQAAVAASASPLGMADPNCEAHHSSLFHVSGPHALPHGGGACDGAGGHGGCGHHACAHASVVVIALPCGWIPSVECVGMAPAATRVAYDSIVLDVPSPPPTLLA